MKFSVIRTNGDIDDVTYQKNKHLRGYAVYLGKNWIGWALRSCNKWEGWTAISGGHPIIGRRMVRGFHNRRYATNYLLENMPEFKDSNF